ncbi:hypothetical protein SAMN05421879_106197 [Ornithinimicrobium cerasi]|uniref:Uncharacterized protein n=2 Tax=Ornithinimicrobium cerasi TaxID=2248773 RepID=A0A285VQB1_9MICO|nr:hypothetical protein SAMN05421879_106197 [Ornithinimicrobium cerasi]
MSPRRDYVGEAPPRHGLLCALCQASTSLTKAHIPPRSAENRGATVKRARPYIEDQVRRLEPPNEGGLWLRTLCQDCNGLASKYDGAYGDFAEALLPHVGGHPLTLPSRNGVPPVAVAPGRVARSVLHAMVALAPSFNVIDRRFVRDLLEDGDDLRLPGGMSLRVALTSDRHARIASAYHLHRVLGVRQDYEAFAEIYFRPLVWLLTGGPSTFGNSLPDQEGWGDATDWIAYTREAQRADLRDVLTRLPHTVHPSHRPGSADQWIEMSGPTSYVLEGRITS